jgi:hypothetical protein
MATQIDSCKFPMVILILGTNKFGLNHTSLGLFFFARIVFEHVVHLLEGPALGFWHKEESPYSGEQAKDSEEDVSTVASVLDERRGDETLQRLLVPVTYRGTK